MLETYAAPLKLHRKKKIPDTSQNHGVSGTRRSLCSASAGEYARDRWDTTGEKFSACVSVIHNQHLQTVLHICIAGVRIQIQRQNLDLREIIL